MAISRSIVEAVRCMNPPGRFLEKSPDTGLYSDIGDKKAIEKTSQALRDGAASLRKQLSEDLGDPDFLSAVFDVETKDGVDGADKDKVKPLKPIKKVRNYSTVSAGMLGLCCISLCDRNCGFYTACSSEERSPTSEIHA